jgi:hypothetical protein
MTAAAHLPSPWPAQMRAETAARYLDEVSTAAFLRGVKTGVYPAARRVAGKGLRWMIEDLDAARARIRSGPSPRRSLKDRVGRSS